MHDNNLIQWQQLAADAFCTAQDFINVGNYAAAINWQVYAAYCHNSYWSNYCRYY